MPCRTASCGSGTPAPPPSASRWTPRPTRGVGVRILTGRLSGSYSPTGEGKFFFTMMAAFAELERDIIHERTMAAWSLREPRDAAADGLP